MQIRFTRATTDHLGMSFWRQAGGRGMLGDATRVKDTGDRVRSQQNHAPNAARTRQVKVDVVRLVVRHDIARERVACDYEELKRCTSWRVHTQARYQVYIQPSHEGGRQYSTCCRRRPRGGRRRPTTMRVANADLCIVVHSRQHAVVFGITRRRSATAGVSAACTRNYQRRGPTEGLRQQGVLCAGCLLTRPTRLFARPVLRVTSPDANPQAT